MQILRSIFRLRMSLESERRNSLLTAARNEQKVMNTYKVCVPTIDNVTDHEIDLQSQSVLQMFHPALLGDFYPASVVGDGNCMYRAVSRALSGTENHHVLLRLNTALEIILNRQYYDTKSKTYKDLICDNRVIVSDYHKLVRDSVMLGSYSELAHIYALSASIKSPIRSYLPPQVCSDFLSEPFTRKVVGRKVNMNSDSVATLMWTQMHAPRSIRDFSPNHFVPIIQRKKPITEVIDLVNRPTDSLSCSMETTTKDSEIDLLPSDSLSNQSTNTTNSLEIEGICNESIEIYEGNESESESHASAYENTNVQSSNDIEDTSFEKTELSEANVSESPLIKSEENTNESSNDSSLHSVASVQQFDSKTSGHLNGVFLEIHEILHILRENETPLEYIPEGTKENVYFVINNEQNVETRAKKYRSNFRDDCGIWDSSKGTTPKTSYLILPGGGLKKIVKRKDLDNLYCIEKKAKGKKVYEPLQPQPTDNDILTIHRYYAFLKADNTYKKRVSWLSSGGNTQIAIAEYIGNYPGLGPHGNSKYKTEYMRTPHYVMVEMGELLKSNKPQQVYDKLTLKYDELSGPANCQQVYDKKKRDVNNKRKENGHEYNRNNFADHIKEIENRVSANDHFIRSVVRLNGKSPCIILYTDEQIEDLKTLCCSGQTVWGLDKTFNLCDMHVTMSSYKQLSVTRDTSSEPPLFFGPMYIHDNSDFESYSIFFSHIKAKLSGIDTSKLVIGTDDERALVNAITSSFSESRHILCSRHIRQNINQKLTDAAVDKSDRNMLLNKMFGEDGIINANDTVCFEEKCEEVEQLSQSISRSFLNYFQKRVKENLNKKRQEPEGIAKTDRQWTNNNCESLNHVLKQTIDWKSQPLMDLIESVKERMESQFKELRRSIVGMGKFMLAESHEQFSVSRGVWAKKTLAEQDRHYKRFKDFVLKDKRIVKTTDGQSNVVAPRTKGKKINQCKRKRTERTMTNKKIKS